MRSFDFVVVPDLLDEVRGAIGDGDYGHARLDALATVDLLVLDDLGAGRATDWSADVLSTIVAGMDRIPYGP